MWSMALGCPSCNIQMPHSKNIYIMRRLLLVEHNLHSRSVSHCLLWWSCLWWTQTDTAEPEHCLRIPWWIILRCCCFSVSSYLFITPSWAFSALWHHYSWSLTEVTRVVIHARLSLRRPNPYLPFCLLNSAFFIPIIYSREICVRDRVLNALFVTEI